MDRPTFVPEGSTASNVRSLLERLRDNRTYEWAIYSRANDGSQRRRIDAIDLMIAETEAYHRVVWAAERAEETITPPSFAGFEIGDRVRLPWRGKDGVVVAFHPTFEPTHLECKDDAGKPHTVLPQNAKLLPRD